jgi:hypothetical protein
MKNSAGRFFGFVFDGAAVRHFLFDNFFRDFPADFFTKFLPLLKRTGVGQKRRNNRSPARRQRSPGRPNMERRNMSVPHIFFVDGIH